MNRKTLLTNSGMWILWDYSSYSYIDSYDDWSDVFEEEEDIVKAIERKKIVPINIGSDGVFDFSVKLNEELTEREKKYLLVSSKNYVINSSGKLMLSGIEYIDGAIKENNYISIETSKGYHRVRINLIDWKKEPASLDENNLPSKDSLPDFIIEIDLLEGNILEKDFSFSIKTF